MRKLKQQEDKLRNEYERRIINLYDEISKMAMIGYNNVYSDYIRSQLKQVEKSNESPEAKELKKNFLETQLKNFTNFLGSIGKKIFG